MQQSVQVNRSGITSPSDPAFRLLSFKAIRIDFNTN
jgi:hypothetical protein